MEITFQSKVSKTKIASRNPKFCNSDNNKISIVKVNTIFMFAVLIMILPASEARNVSCNNLGTCTITYVNGYEFIPSAFGANLNFFEDKYLKENSQNYAPTAAPIGSIFTAKLDPKVEMLFGSQTYQCADGLDECPDKCCKMGICSDPSNVCLRQKANRDLIFIITGSLFALFVIAYWIVFFYLGVKYNATFSPGSNIKALDMIYRKPFKKVENAEAPDTDFNPNANYEEYVRKKAQEGQEENISSDLNNAKHKNYENIIDEGLNNDKEANKFLSEDNLRSKGKAKFMNYDIENLYGNQMQNKINYKSNDENENEIIEEDQKIDVLGSNNFNNAALYSRDRFEGTQATRIFNGGNLNRNNPLIKSATSNTVKAPLGRESVFEMKTAHIIKEENNQNKTGSHHLFQGRENYQKLNQLNTNANANANELHFKNEKLMDAQIKRTNDIAKDRYDKVGLDSESNRDKYDIFSSQNSFPSKSVNSKRRLIKRVKTNKNENPIRSSVLSNLDEKENLNFMSEKDLDSETDKIDVGGNQEKMIYNKEKSFNKEDEFEKEMINYQERVLEEKALEDN